MLGRRLNEHRNNFVLPDDMGWPNLDSDGKEELASHEEGKTSLHSFGELDQTWCLCNCFDSSQDASLDWDSAIHWLRSKTRLQLWLKGVTCAEDVALAVQYKLDGIVVSNHGGRQLDGQPATLDALRECAPVAAGRIPIAVDGGIRRGSDIFKALALGASHCFVGRMPIWGLAVCDRLSPPC